MTKASDYFDLSVLRGAPYESLFNEIHHVWEVLPKIASFFKSASFHAKIEGEVHPSAQIGSQVYIGKGSRIAAGVVIQGPAWIGENCDIRPGAFIRENVIIGSESVIGNSSELKNSLLLHKGQLPHFNYAGDSVLGSGAHLGAGVILSNFKLTADTISVRIGDQKISTGLRKLGAIIGDRAEIGCHAVLNPGSMIGPRSMIYSGVQWRGVLPADQIVKATTSYSITNRTHSSIS